MSMDIRYKETHKIEHLGNDGDIHAVKFYPYQKPGQGPIFAIAGGKRIWICATDPDADLIEIIHNIGDPDPTIDSSDRKPATDFYSLAWCKDVNSGDPILLVSGRHGKILVIDGLTGDLKKTIFGHGGHINEIVTHPLNPSIFATCSDDHTVRVWSIHEDKSCVAILANYGHRDIVECLAFHKSGRYIISGGSDRCINLWVLPSFPDANTGTDKPTRIHYPHFSSSDIHDNVVDCVIFYNDLIISRSDRESKIVLWSINGFTSSNGPPPISTAPTSLEHGADTCSAFASNHPMFTRILEFSTPHSDFMFMRFSLSSQSLHAGPTLAFCNTQSSVYFWDLRRLEHYWSHLNLNTERPAWLPKPRSATAVPSAPTPGRLRETSVPDSTSSKASEASKTAEAEEVSAKTQKKVQMMYEMTSPQRPLLAHQQLKIPEIGGKGVRFFGRQVAWSPGGEWCVVVGHPGVVAVLERWGGKVQSVPE